MVQLTLLLSFLVFHQIAVYSESKSCPIGHRVSKNDCVICSSGFYQSEVNHSPRCKVCSRCGVDTGSEVTANCTSKSNTKCRCRSGFKLRDDDSSTCKCDRGFGLKHGECLECADGYFSDRIDSACEKWRKCGSGVYKNGTKISDVVCVKDSRINANVTAKTTSNRVLPVNTPTAPQPQRDGGDDLNQHTNIITENVITSAPGHPREQEKTHPQASITVMCLLIFGIVLLLLTTLVICRMFAAPRHQRKPAIQPQDSLCQRPVEESGDDSRSSLKQFPAEL